MEQMARVLPKALPPVDDHLVMPECGYEILEGRLIKVPPAHWPHASRHSKLGALLEAFVREDYDAAVDMLTRVSEDSDIAPDAAVLRRGRDSETGGRFLEELAFEILNTQALSACTVRARLLSDRGVRRVFAIDVVNERAFEWNPQAGDWWTLPADSSIIDQVLVTPLAVEALVYAAKTDDAVARALLAKNNAVLAAALHASEQKGREAGLQRGLEEGRERGLEEGRERGLEEGRERGLEEGRERGLEEGRAAGLREALLFVLTARGVTIDAAARARIDDADPGALAMWLARAGEAADMDDLLG